MSMKNSNDTIGNRSRDLPVFSAVPQPLRHHVPSVVVAVVVVIFKIIVINEVKKTNN
jgi:hypothetical protein